MGHPQDAPQDEELGGSDATLARKDAEVATAWEAQGWFTLIARGSSTRTCKPLRQLLESFSWEACQWGAKEHPVEHSAEQHQKGTLTLCLPATPEENRQGH